MKTSFLPLVAVIALLVLQLPAAPLNLHPDNPHYFVYQGKPTVLVGSGEHYGAVINLDFDWELYLETMAAEGQNLTRLFTGSYVEKPGAFNIEKNTLAPAENRFQPPWARSEISGYINGGNKFDLDRWNPDYFSRLRDFVKQAGELGIIVEVVMFSSIYNEGNWSYSPFHPDNNVNGIKLDDRRKCNTLANGNIFSYQEEMVRKIVSELNGFDNLYYEIQNEPWSDLPGTRGFILEHLADDDLPSSWQNEIALANQASLEWQKAISAIIRDEENDLPREHLIAQNYCNYGYPVMVDDKNISVLNFHYALPRCVDLNLGWNLPVAFDESGFAGPGPGVYRRQAWRFLLSGGAVFNGLDYSFYPGFEDGTGEIRGPGGGGKELRLQLAVLRKFLEGFDLPRLSPDHESIVLHPGLQYYLLSTPGEQYACYLEGEPEGDLTLQLPAGDYLARWHNPLNGRIIKQLEVTHSGGLLELQVPESAGEMALDIHRD